MGVDGREVMIVEDDEDLREALVPVLQYEGYSVASAANGREAIDRLRRGEKPCVILLDLMMPVMDGSQFRSAQLEDPALASIPVIIVSADGSVRQKAAALGVVGYVRKPIDLDVLLDMIKQHC